MKNYLKQLWGAKIGVIIVRTYRNKHSIVSKTKYLMSYLKDIRKFQNLPSNSAFSFLPADLFPRIYDKTTTHGVDPVYFLQGCWCAKKIFENTPSKHFDIGSQSLMVGIISQFVPTTMLDIRPLGIELSGLSFQKADVLKLPFADNQIESLSSICVLEHIGLGRYGDTLDQFGSEKAIAEVVRVLAPRGHLYISLPIDSKNKVYFNAHRSFTRTRIIELFSKLSLVEEKYIYGKDMHTAYDSTKGFGTGLYHFQKK